MLGIELTDGDSLGVEEGCADTEGDSLGIELGE